MRWLLVLGLMGCDTADPLGESAPPDALPVERDFDLTDVGSTDVSIDAESDADPDMGRADAAAGLKVLGHRGYAWNRIGNPYPENTILSVNAALEAGADGVEIDIVKTADDVIVLRHDDNLATLSPDDGISRTDCRGRITQMNWEELQDCNAQAHSEDGQTAPLDRLEDLLAIPMDMLVLDVKNDGDNVDEERAIEVILNQVFEAGAEDRVVMMLYGANTIQLSEAVGVRSCLKRQRRAELTGEEIAALVADVGAWASCAESRMVDAPLMDSLLDEDRGQVTFYLGDNPTPGYTARIESFVELGVTGAIVDQIEHVVDVRDGPR